MVRPRACCFLMSHWALGYIVRHLLDFFHRTSFFDILFPFSFLQTYTQCPFIVFNRQCRKAGLHRRWRGRRCIIMKPFAEEFYKSQAWRSCREAYISAKRGLCERCLEQGIYNAGVIVHHKVHITPVNITDPNVTLNWNNLQLLCRDCHAAVHARQKRYTFDAYGRCSPVPESGPRA